MPEVSVSSLRAGYLGRTVIRDVSFRADPGTLVAVVGPNGSGKTTLLKCVTGLLAPYEGKVAVGGRDVARMTGRERAALVAYVPQRGREDWSFPVGEYVALGRYAALGTFGVFGKKDRAACSRAMEAVDVSSFSKATMGELSGGEAGRVRVARALAQGADILVLDEPLANMDPGRQVEFMRLLSSVAASGSVVMASIHDLNAAMRHADLALLVRRDGSVRSGTSAEVFGDRGIEDAFESGFVRGVHDDYGEFILPVHEDGQP